MSVLQGKTVMVVEDEELLRDILVEYLVARGARTVHTADRQTALTLARDEHPDIVISDLRMPGCDGLSLMREILATVSPALPFVLITGYSDFSEREARAAGARAVLAKPFRVTALEATITEILGGP